MRWIWEANFKPSLLVTLGKSANSAEKSALTASGAVTALEVAVSTSMDPMKLPVHSLRYRPCFRVLHLAALDAGVPAGAATGSLTCGDRPVRHGPGQYNKKNQLQG